MNATHSNIYKMLTLNVLESEVVVVLQNLENQPIEPVKYMIDP